MRIVVVPFGVSLSFMFLTLSPLLHHGGEWGEAESVGSTTFEVSVSLPTTFGCRQASFPVPCRYGVRFCELPISLRPRSYRTDRRPTKSYLFVISLPKVVLHTLECERTTDSKVFRRPSSWGPVEQPVRLRGASTSARRREDLNPHTTGNGRWGPSQPVTGSIPPPARTIQLRRGYD
jgi:hypothetical protein